MPQQKPTLKKIEFVEVCAKGMYVLLAAQAIPAIIFWIVYAVMASAEKKTEVTIDEVKATVKEIVITEVKNTSSTEPPSSSLPPTSTRYTLEFAYNNKVGTTTLFLPDPRNVGDIVPLYITNNDVKSASYKKPVPASKFSTLFLFLASAFTISFFIGIAIYNYAKNFACFLVILNVLIIILSILKSKKLI